MVAICEYSLWIFIWPELFLLPQTARFLREKPMTNVISQWAWLPQTFYGGNLFQEKIIYLCLFLRVLFSRNIFLALKKLPTQTVNENFREWKHWYTYLYTYTFIQIQNTHTRVFCLILSSRFHFLFFFVLLFFKWTIHFLIVILIHEDNRPQMQHKKIQLWERERERERSTQWYPHLREHIKPAMHSQKLVIWTWNEDI